MGSIIFICAGAAEGGGEVVVAFLGEAEGVVVGFFYNGHRAGIAHETQAVVAEVVRAGGGFPLRSNFILVHIAVSRGIFVNVAFGLCNELQYPVFVLEIILVVRCAFHSSVFHHCGRRGKDREILGFYGADKSGDAIV